MAKGQENVIDAADAATTIFLSFCLVTVNVIAAFGVISPHQIIILCAILSMLLVLGLSLPVAPQLGWPMASGSIFLAGGTIIWCMTIFPETRLWLPTITAVCWLVLPTVLTLFSTQIYLITIGLFLVVIGPITLVQYGAAGTVKVLLLLAVAVMSALVVLSPRPERVGSTPHGPVARSRFELHLLRHIWPACAMQTGLVLLLVFSDIVFWSIKHSPTLAIRLYGLLFVVLGSFVLSAVDPKRRGVFLLFHTIVVGVLVVVGTPIQLISLGEAETQLLLSLLALGVLCATTLAVPWPLTFQVILSWAMLLLGGALFALVRIAASSSFWSVTDLYGTLGKATVVLVCTEAAVVLLARSMRIYTIGSLPDEDKLRSALAQPQRDGEQSYSTPTAVQTLTHFSAREGIGQARLRQLWRVLLIIGALSTIVSLSLTEGFSIMQLGFGGFYILWALVLVLLRKQAHEEHLWYLAALASLLLLLWSSTLIVLSGTKEEAWLFFPLSIVIGVGFIPWRLSELFPLVVAGTLVGTASAQAVGQSLYGIAFLVSALLSLYLAVTTFRETKERYLLLEFQRSLRRCLNEQEASRLLADHLMTLFDVPEALIVSARNVELIYDSQLFILTKNAVPLPQLMALKKDTDMRGDDIGISVIDWIPAAVAKRFSDQGLFSPQHGLLIEIRLGNGTESDERINVLPTQQRKEQSGGESGFIIFLPLKSPWAKLFRAGEITLAHTLAGEALLVLGTFAERAGRSRDYRAHLSTLMARDYELSSLVHDINNTVQDLILLCDTITDQSTGQLAKRGEVADISNADTHDNSTMSNVKRIAAISRMIATVVSDVKRKRELDRQANLSPRENVDLKLVAEEIIAFAQVRGERRRVGVSSHNIDGESVWVFVSSYDHLETVVRNLVSNALSRSKPGTNIELSVRLSDQWVSLDIRDTGPGYSKEEMRLLFEDVVVRDSTATAGETEVGLKQLRRFAEEQGGTLDVESAGAGQGATFTLMLPRRQAPRDGARRMKSWVLIVDDEPVLTAGYARIARALHLEAVVAYTIDEAQELLKDQTPPVLVMTDLFLQEKSGIELIRLIRKVYGIKIPILVVSGTADEESIAEIRKAGATDFIVKPVGQRALYTRLQTLLGREN